MDFGLLILAGQVSKKLLDLDTHDCVHLSADCCHYCPRESIRAPPLRGCGWRYSKGIFQRMYPYGQQSQPQYLHSIDWHARLSTIRAARTCPFRTKSHLYFSTTFEIYCSIHVSCLLRHLYLIQEQEFLHHHA
jgi:hypothetical protein